MDQDYREVFDNAMIYENLKELSRLYAVTDKHGIIPLWNRTVSDITELCKSLQSENAGMSAKIMQTASAIRDEFDNDGYVQYLLEGTLIPLIMDYLHRYNDISVDDGYWDIHGTPSGFVTIKRMNDNKFMHSAFDPMWEAGLLADQLYEAGMRDYHVFGCGLGYLPYQLWKTSDGSLNVHVYALESDGIEYARLFGPLELIAEDKLDLRIFNDIESMAKAYIDVINSDDKYNAFPSELFQEEVREVYGDSLDSWFAQYRTNIVSRKIWKINESFNMELMSKTHLDLPVSGYGPEWLVLAAGPSFDDNIEFIRDSIGNRTVIAVSTLIPKLEKEGITPDLLIVCDPYEFIMPHIRGHEAFTENIPLIAHKQTYWEFIRLYRGPVYRMAEAGDEPLTDSGQVKYPEWHGGGTVTSMAVEAACLMGASKIYVAGMDLAFPGGARYSGGIGNQNNLEASELPFARSNDGSIVTTAYNFMFYGEQMKNQAEYHSEVEIWNLSKHGLYIPSLRTGRWWEEGVTPDTLPVEWIENIKRDDFLNWREKYYLLRQLADREDTVIDEQVLAGVQPLLEEIMHEMIAENGITDRISYPKGTDMKVLVSSSLDFGDRFGALRFIDTQKDKNRVILIVDTRERLSGDRVYIKNELFPDKKVNAPVDNIGVYRGIQYAYFRLNALDSSARQISELGDILQNQGGIEMVHCDPFSLFSCFVKQL